MRFFLYFNTLECSNKKQFYLKVDVKAKGRREVSKWTGLFSGIIPGVISHAGAGCRKPKINTWVIYSHFLNYFSANDPFSCFSPQDKSCSATHLSPMVFFLKIIEPGNNQIMYPYSSPLHASLKKNFSLLLLLLLLHHHASVVAPGMNR